MRPSLNSPSSSSQVNNSITSVVVIEPEDLVTSSINAEGDQPLSSQDSKHETPASTDVPAILPPKKFFKSKAAQKETVDLTSTRVSPTPIPEHERANFRNWLDAKLSPIKQPVNNLDTSQEDQSHPITNGVDVEGNRYCRASFNSDIVAFKISFQFDALHQIVDLVPGL